MRGILIGAAVMLASGAAFAQPTAGAKDDTTGLFCVYNALTANGGAKVVAEVFLQHGIEDSEGDAWAVRMIEAVEAQDAATDACSEEYDLTPGKGDAATDMGVFGAAIDHLNGQLAAAGMNKRALGRMYGVYDGLEDDEADLFLSEGWREDAAFAAKIRKQLKTAGVPDKDETMEMAFSILELSALSDEVIFSFLTDDL